MNIGKRVSIPLFHSPWIKVRYSGEGAITLLLGVPGAPHFYWCVEQFEIHSTHNSGIIYHMYDGLVRIKFVINCELKRYMYLLF